MELQMNKDELYVMLKKAVREVLEEERFNFILQNLPPASSEEMKDIEKTYGKPPDKLKSVHSEKIEI